MLELEKTANYSCHLKGQNEPMTRGEILGEEGYIKVIMSPSPEAPKNRARIHYENYHKEAIMAASDLNVKSYILGYVFDPTKDFKTETTTKVCGDEKMVEDERKYLPGERELYKQLSREEKQEWDSLGKEDRKFYLEMGKIDFSEIDNNLKNIDDQIKKISSIKKSNNEALNNLEKEVDSFNYRFNIFEL